MRAERIYLDITKDRIIVVERALHSSFSPIIKISRIDEYKFADRILALSQTDITTSDISHSDEQNSWNKIYHYQFLSGARRKQPCKLKQYKYNNI